MSETIALQKKIDDLQAANNSMTGVLRNFGANKKALELTVQELMTNNINMRGALELAADHANESAAKIQNLEARIKEFEDKAKAAEAPAEEKAAETAPVEDSVEAA